MKRLMLTTAMCTGVAVAAVAQTAETGMAGFDTAAQAVPAFLASDFTGQRLYTLDSEDARGIGRDAGDLSVAERDRLRWTSSDAFIADRDSWQTVGSIEDIVMTKDGEIRGVLIDVGGFLGFGARSVMVDIEELYFVTDEGAPEDIDDFFLVIAMSQEELEALPEFDRDQLRSGFEVREHRVGMDMTPGAGTAEPAVVPASMSGDLTDGGVFGEDHRMLGAEERTADRLIGAEVFDAAGESIGSVDDVVIGADNAIDGVIVDIGGFLGIGAHTVMLPLDDAQIGWNDVDGDVRVQVGMTRDQLEAMPEYEG